MESKGDPLSRLPHGFPFRFVDRIVELIPGERAITLKNVTTNDYCMQGHFPGNPVMPGVLLLEAMAQTSGLLLPEGSSAVLAQVKEARFRRPVVPGDQVRIEAVRLTGLGTLHRFEVKTFVGGAPVAEAEIVLAVSSRGGEDRV
ncbi:MAG TPA: 3-hydroxyacyl-ACP dehydratase FabZ [Candidatus Methylomirabilis sp.]|nr:3-hydroxyacyl-ACP dehydratase FabZ [Candidatus Methylomirabilis sp.]